MKVLKYVSRMVTLVCGNIKKYVNIAVTRARRDGNSATSALSESLDISGLNKTYSLFGVSNVLDNIFARTLYGLAVYFADEK